MTADEAMILIGNFAQRVKQADAAARREEAKIGVELGRLPENSVEYALAVCALASQEFESQRAQFSELVRLLRKIRPPRGKGRMAREPIPPEFGDMWPHERLGHLNWTSFVTTKRSGERDPNNPEKYIKPPGLGWAKAYESNIAKGFEQIEKLVQQAMPNATPEERDAKVDEVTAGAGPDATFAMGTKVVGSNNLDTVAARAAADALASGAVAADDIRERGAEALTDPRPKGRQRGATADVDGVLRKVSKWPLDAVRELVSRLEHEVLRA
jgi:hypothetical protein